MPVRTVPWDQLSIDHVQELIDRQIRESRTLDYKATLKLDDSGKLDLLEDVTAMANAAGGTILYGAVEGEGEEAALIVRYEGMSIEPDAVDLQISQLLRDGVEERLPHVLHRAIAAPGGGYLYAIRIPPSPRAPHRVTRRSNRDRFFVRGNVSNEPMRMEQIREALLRSDGMIERARHLISERTSATFEFIDNRPEREVPLANQDSTALLHIIPLDQSPGMADLSSQQVADRMKQVRGYGSPYEGNLRWSLEGLFCQSDVDGVHRQNWALLTRNGSLEFGEVDTLGIGGSFGGVGTAVLDIWHLDHNVLACIEQARSLAVSNWFTTPFLLSFRLLNVQNAFLVNHKQSGRTIGRKYGAKNLIVEPEIVSDWNGSVNSAVRRIFDTVWQAFGQQRCALYNADGTRRTSDAE